MTHSCGKPHAVGDKGQPFEVSYFDPALNERRVLGWSDTAEGAQRLSKGIDLHPSWQFAQIRDRRVTA